MIFLPRNVNPEELITTISSLCWDIDNIFKYYTQNNQNSNDFKKKLEIQNLNTGPVTNADVEISNFIKKGISEKYPNVDWEFLSEEDYHSNDDSFHEREWMWIIDPLDGTKDFIQGTGEYAMHLALTYQKKIIIGYVLIPSKQELWINVKGQETWCEYKGVRKEISIEPSCKKVDQLTIIRSKSHYHPAFKFLLEKLNPKNIMGVGSVGYKITSILRGDADVYLSYSLPNGSSPKDWDIAAPLAIIEGAGGYFTDIKGRKLDFLKGSYDQEGILIASMTSNHYEICKKISNIVNT